MTNRLFYAYARHALVTALRMARVTTGSTVLVPHFICRDVLASISAVSAKPVFYDIDDNLQVSQNTTLPSAAAVLAVNYFGFPADLGRLRQQLSDPTTIIIEDNAHGWLSADENGVPLGTRTALGITSFRKTLLCPDGAFLSWNDDPKIVSSEIHQPLGSRADSLGLGFRARYLTKRLELLTSLPVRSLSRVAIRASRRALRKPAVYEYPGDEFELPAQHVVHRFSLKLFQEANQLQEVSRRRRLFEQCQMIADGLNIEPVFNQLSSGISPQGFPYFKGRSDDGEFLSQVNRRRIGEIMPWPSLPELSGLPTNSRLRSLQLVNFL